ncbi:hypothetical protein BGZ83_003373, partial [Gryganskiella cystojenkinii]
MNNNEKEQYTKPLTPSLPSSPSPPSSSSPSSPPSENIMTVPRWQLPPELAIMIARYLTRAETSSCVCVSDMWSTIWSPILWQSIVLGKRRCTLFKHTLETPTFLRNRFFIHTFRAAAFGLALGSLLLAANCQQLRALELWFEVALSEDAVADILDYAEALPAAAAFSRLSPSDVVLGLLNKNTSMKELSITGDFEHLVGPDQQDAAPAVPMTNILSFIQADNLESLSIEFQQMNQSQYERSWKKVATLLPRLRRLEVLNFTGSDTPLMEFITRCPGLTSLNVRRDFSYDPVINGELIWDSFNVLQYIGLTLKALKELVWEVDGDDDVCNDMLQNIFLINPGQLTKINIRAPSTSCSLLAREAMLKAAASLEELTLDGVTGLRSTQIQEFMQQAANLKVFKILTLSRSYDKVVDRPLCWWHLYDPEGDNDDETRPWACEQTLERLAVVIQ